MNSAQLKAINYLCLQTIGWELSKLGILREFDPMKPGHKALFRRGQTMLPMVLDALTEGSRWGAQPSLEFTFHEDDIQAGLKVSDELGSHEFDVVNGTKAGGYYPTNVYATLTCALAWLEQSLSPTVVEAKPTPQTRGTVQILTELIAHCSSDPELEAVVRHSRNYLRKHS